ncbi:MAG TPA: phosphotransferase [Chloroflexia bacterium]
MSTEGPDTPPDRAERAFAHLPHRTQIARMRQVAVAALAAYDLPPVRVRLLAHRFNTTFHVDTEGGARYVLRINRAGAPTVETVGSELAWLAALRRDTALEVPAPVATRAGALLTVADAPGVPHPHICVLFRWMPGHLSRHGLTPRRMERVGVLMAQLQDHADHWERPPGFTRGRVDWPVAMGRTLPDPYGPEVVAYIEGLVAETLSAVEAAPVTEALARVRAAVQALGQGPDAFGLIHADLHYGNLLFSGDTVRAIDFDDCGFGFRLFDFGVMLSAVLDWPAYPALRAALLAGYRRVRPLPAAHEAHLDAFIALRLVQDALWILEWRRHPALGADWAGQAREVLATLAAFLATGSVAPAGS